MQVRLTRNPVFLKVLGIVLGLCVIRGPEARGQVAAERTAAGLKPAQGLEATLWAAEPMLANPTTIDIDSRGRVWVAEGLNYRLTRGGNRRFHRIEEADRIKILEDTDGDGKADKVTVFADRIFPVPMGLAVEEHHDAQGRYTGCRVFVGNSPDLLVLEDTDGDDKVDRRYPLLTGFGGVDSDHGVHGMVLALDGKLYFTHGDGCCSVQQDHSERPQNFNVTDKSGRRVWTDQLANTLRVNRDGTQFEIICDRQRNNYETSLNSFGEIFTSDNDDDGNRGCRVIQAMDGGHFGYHTPGSPLHWGEDTPGVVPKLVGTGNGSPCGILVYEGSLLPAEYRGAILEVDAGTRQVNFFPLTRERGVYHAEYKVFLGGSDPWFRPVDACVAPDGSVFVADWYDAGVGGHGFSDQTTGRIYRVAPRGAKPALQRPDFASMDGLLAALRSPNIATQDAARQGLITLAKTQPVAQRLADLAYHDADPILRARAIWVAWAVSGPEPLLSLLSDPMSHNEPRIRAQIVRMIGRDCSRNGHVEGGQSPASNLDQKPYLDVIKAMAKDEDSQVRREVILALRNRPTAEVGETLRELAARWDGQDRWYLEALGLALERRESDYLAHLLDGSLQGAIDWSTDGKTGDVALPPYFPTDRNEAFIPPGAASLKTSRLSTMLGLCWRLHRAEALPFLERAAASIRAVELEEALIEVLGRIEDPAAAATLAKLAGQATDPEQRRAYCSALARGLDRAWISQRQAQPIVDLIERLLSKPEGRLDGIALATAARDGRYQARIEQLAVDPQAGVEIRVAAIQALGGLGGSAPILLGKLVDAAQGQSSKTPESEAAVRSLARSRDSSARLLALAQARDYPLGLRRQALRAVAEQAGGGRILLELVQKRAIADDLKPEAADLLFSSLDRRLRAEAARLFPAPKAAGGRTLPPPAILARRQGDAARGRQVFFRDSADSCARCHRVPGRGQWVGPDLSTIGVKYGRAELFHSILNPSAAVGFSFRTVIAALNDGRLITGLPVSENPDRLVLKTAQGERVELATRDIVERRTSDVSLMPEGLASSLSEQQLVDLVAYLSTLKQPVSVLGQAYAAGPVDAATARRLSTAPIGQQTQQSVAVRRLTADAEGRIDLGRLRGNEPGKGACLTSPLVSPLEQDARIVLESSSEIEAWLDGQPLALEVEPGPATTIRTTNRRLPGGPSRLSLYMKGGRGKDLDGRIVVTVISDRAIGFDPASAQARTTP